MAADWGSAASETAELPVLEEDFAALAAAAGGDLRRLEGCTLVVDGVEGLLGGGLVRALAWCRRYGLSAPARVVALADPDAPVGPAGRVHRDPAVEVLRLEPEAPIPGHLDARFAVLAPAAVPRPGGADPLAAMEARTSRARRTLRWAEGCRRLEALLLVSDAAVYGSLGAEEVPAAEDARPGPLGPASVAAQAAAYRYCEELALAAAYARGVPVRIARSFHVYGPGLGLDSGTVIADFLRDRLAGGPIRLRAEGDRVRSFCYLADALAGVLGMLVRGHPGEVFNLGNERETVTVVELARLVARLETPRLEVVPVEGNPAPRLAESPRRLVPDCGRARHRLGFAPRTPLPEGLRRTLRWLREAGVAAPAPRRTPGRTAGSPGFASMPRPCTSLLRPLRPGSGAPGRPTPI